MTPANVAFGEVRREERDEVHHRTRAVAADGRMLTFLIVNISPHGLMARCDSPFGEGDMLTVALPGVGPLCADVRWALGGRVGCQFRLPIERPRYDKLLAVLLR